MRARNVVALVVGSLAVAGLVACAAEVAPRGQTHVLRDAGGDVVAEVREAGGVIDAVLDVFIDDDPVRDARAEDAATGPTVDEVACDKPIVGTSLFYGEKAYPGRSKEQLVRASVMSCAGGDYYPPGYTCVSMEPLFVRDGALAVRCVTQSIVTVSVP